MDKIKEILRKTKNPEESKKQWFVQKKTLNSYNYIRTYILT